MWQVIAQWPNQNAVLELFLWVIEGVSLAIVTRVVEHNTFRFTYFISSTWRYWQRLHLASTILTVINCEVSFDTRGFLKIRSTLGDQKLFRARKLSETKSSPGDQGLTLESIGSGDQRLSDYRGSLKTTKRLVEVKGSGDQKIFGERSLSRSLKIRCLLKDL